MKREWKGTFKRTNAKASTPLSVGADATGLPISLWPLKLNSLRKQVTESLGTLVNVRLN